MTRQFATVPISREHIAEVDPINDILTVDLDALARASLAKDRFHVPAHAEFDVLCEHGQPVLVRYVWETK